MSQFDNTVVAHDRTEDEIIRKRNPNIRKTSLRWLSLVLTCFSSLGFYYCFDNPQALQTYIEDQFSLSNYQFNLLYTIFSLPNIIFPLIGGVIIDKLGIQISITTFAFITIIGQVIFTWGAYVLNYPFMIFGRAIFGIGAESLSVAQSTMVAKWFKGKELAFAMGFLLSMYCGGDSLNSVLSPKIYQWFNRDLYVPLLIGVFVTIFSWVCSIGAAIIDKRADKADGFKGEESQPPSCNDVKEFNKLYVLLMANCFFLYGGFFGIMDNINNLINVRFGLDPQTAGNYITIVYLSAGILTPTFGLIVDKLGKKISLMVFISTIFAATHFFIAFLNDAPNDENPNYWIILGLVGCGLFYAIYASVFWPCIALVIPERICGTGYGLATSVQNSISALIPLVTAAIHDNTLQIDKGYFWTEIALGFSVILGILATIWLYFEDKKTGGVLQKKSENKESIVQEGKELLLAKE